MIIKKTVEDFQAVNNDILGVSKNLGQGQKPRAKSFAHGIKNVQGNDPWNAARCIHGEPTLLEVQPDKDLGRSTKYGCRNLVKCEADSHRAFGLPTVRTDKPKKRMVSVADF